MANIYNTNTNNKNNLTQCRRRPFLHILLFSATLLIMQVSGSGNKKPVQSLLAEKPQPKRATSLLQTNQAKVPSLLAPPKGAAGKQRVPSLLDGSNPTAGPSWKKAQSLLVQGGSSSGSGRRLAASLLPPQAPTPAAKGPAVCACWRKESLANMEWILQDVVPNKYKISKKEISSGTQGNVYHGYSYGSRQCVAVKITKNYSDKLEEVAKHEIALLRELSANKSLTRILKMIYFHDAKEKREMTLVMEQGWKNLFEYWYEFLQSNIGNEVVLLEELRLLTLEIVEAFVQLHTIAYFIHMDFKPQNVMLMPPKPGKRRGKVVLIDFGGAQKLDKRLVHEGGLDLFFRTRVPETPMSSLFYYPPEARISFYYKFADENESDENRISTASDIWSIGSWLYEMLTTIYTKNGAIAQQAMEFGTAANEFFFSYEPPHFIKDESENWKTVHEKMRDFYLDSEGRKNARNGGLIHMARNCIHADPQYRATIKELHAYMHNKHKLCVSSQYFENREDKNWQKYCKTYEEAMST